MNFKLNSDSRTTLLQRGHTLTLSLQTRCQTVSHMYTHGFGFLTRCKRFLTQLGLPHNEFEPRVDCPPGASKAAYRRVVTASEEAQWAVGGKWRRSASAASYADTGLCRTTLCSPRVLWPPLCGLAMSYLLRFRVGGLYTAVNSLWAPWTRGAGVTSKSDPCPFCRLGSADGGGNVNIEPETVEHLVLWCTAWRVWREMYLERILAEIEAVTASLDWSDEKTIVLLQGGSCSDVKLGHWYSSVSDDAMGAGDADGIHDPVDVSDVEALPDSVCVALFLKEVYTCRLRSMKLWARRAAEADPGMG